MSKQTEQVIQHIRSSKQPVAYQGLIEEDRLLVREMVRQGVARVARHGQDVDPYEIDPSDPTPAIVRLTGDKDPKDVDAILAEAYNCMNTIAYKMASNGREIAGLREEIAEHGDEHGTRYKRIESYEANNQELSAEHCAVSKAAKPHEADYAARRWNRYYLVTNVGGHIHKDVRCQTCFPTTEYAWLTQLSGDSNEAMVLEYGETACTVCYPSAPTMRGFLDGNSAEAKRVEAAKDERAAAKAEREAVKAKKAIFQPDGEPLRELSHSHGVGKGYRINTLVSARRELTRMLVDSIAHEKMAQTEEDDDHGTHLVRMARREREQARYLAEAIANKIAGDVTEIIYEHSMRAEKKINREYAWL